MALGIRKTAKEYVLIGDRELPIELQTVFHIKQKTLDDENELGIKISNSYIQNKRGKATPSKSKMNHADIAALMICVSKVENFFIPEDAASVDVFTPYEYFKKKLDSNPDGGNVVEFDYPNGEDKDGNKKTIKALRIIIAEEEGDLKRIAVALSQSQRAELNDASEDYNKLDDVEKKD